MEFLRGDIYIFNLPKMGKYHIQSGERPCLIVSNDTGNLKSPNVTVLPITSQHKPFLPTHVRLRKDQCEKNQIYGTILSECIVTLDKRMAKGGFVDHVKAYKLNQVDHAMRVQLGLIA